MLFSRPQLFSVEIFPTQHCACAIVCGALFTQEFCLPYDINHVYCRQCRTSFSSGSKRPTFQLSCSSSPLLLFFLLDCCHCCDFFRIVSCALNTLSNVVSVFVDLTSACRITRVILLSSFSLTLSVAAFATGRSLQCLVLTFHHSVCVRKLRHRYALYRDIMFFACVLSMYTIHTSFDNLSMSVLRG